MKPGIFVLVLVAAVTCGLFGIAVGEEPMLKVLWEESFEVGGAAKLPDGWTIFAGETMGRTTDTARTGEYSFGIEDRISTSTGAVGLRSPLVPVEPGKEYVASAWVLAKEGSPSFYIEFWDETKKTRLAPASVSIKVTAQDEWQEAVIKKVAPVNAKYVSVIIYSHAVNTGLGYFDDVQIAAAN